MKEESEDGKLMFDVDDASVLKEAFCAAGWDITRVGKLVRGNYLRDMRPVVDGYAEVTPKKFVVNLEASPASFVGGQIPLTLERHTGPRSAIVTRIGDRLFLNQKK